MTSRDAREPCLPGAAPCRHCELQIENCKLQIGRKGVSSICNLQFAILNLQFLLAGLVLPGCAGTPLPPEADSDKATAALRAGLDAWKKGEKPESLQRGAPAIYFTELRWNAGDRLLDYRLSEAAERFGQSLRCWVTLELQDASGKRIQKKMTYNIDTDAANVVIVPGDM